MHAQIVSLIIEKILAGSNKSMGLLVALALGWQTYQIEQITNTIVSNSYRSTTEYAYQILRLAYKDVANDSEAIELTHSWRVSNMHNSEIAAVRTLCDEEPNRLNGLMHVDTVRSICRIAQ